MTVLVWILVGLFAIPYAMVAHLAWQFWRLTRRANAAEHPGALHGAQLCLLMCLVLLASVARIAMEAAFRHPAKPLPAEAPP